MQKDLYAITCDSQPVRLGAFSIRDHLMRYGDQPFAVYSEGAHVFAYSASLKEKPSFFLFSTDMPIHRPQSAYALMEQRLSPVTGRSSDDSRNIIYERTGYDIRREPLDTLVSLEGDDIIMFPGAGIAELAADTVQAVKRMRERSGYAVDEPRVVIVDPLDYVELEHLVCGLSVHIPQGRMKISKKDVGYEMVLHRLGVLMSEDVAKFNHVLRDDVPRDLARYKGRASVLVDIAGPTCYSKDPGSMVAVLRRFLKPDGMEIII